MNQEFFGTFKETLEFSNLLETKRALLESIMLALEEVINTEKVVEELAQEMEREAEVASPKVAEVLAEVPKSPRMPRPKPTPTKEAGKDKKGK